MLNHLTDLSTIRVSDSFICNMSGDRYLQLGGQGGAKGQGTTGQWKSLYVQDVYLTCTGIITR